MSNNSRIRALIRALVTVGALLTAPLAQAQDFRGGGVITDFAGCEAQGFRGAEFVRARLRLGSPEGNANTTLSLFFPDGAIDLTLPGEIARGTAWSRAWGTAIWFGPGNWDPRPRLRFRQVTPVGSSTVAEATDLMLRLQVRGFNWLAGCNVSIAVALTRS